MADLFQGINRVHRRAGDAETLGVFRRRGMAHGADNVSDREPLQVEKTVCASPLDL